MKNPLSFFRELTHQPTWIPIWVFYLMAINLASFGFWDEFLAKLIFVGFVISALLMMALYMRFGFNKILGLGHIPWIPLLAYIMVQMPAAEGAFKTYLIVLAVSMAASLMFDIVDVWKHFKAQRSRSASAFVARN